MTFRAARPLPFLLMTAILAGPPAFAQGTDTPPPPPQATSAPLPFVEDFLPVADEEQVINSAKAARTAVTAAEEGLTRATVHETDARARVEAQKTMIEGVKLQLDKAKKENRESDKHSLETEKKKEESVLHLYEKLLDLRKSEGLYYESLRDASLAEADLYDHSLSLLRQRKLHASTKSVTSSAQLSQSETALATAEKQILDASKEWSRLFAKAADRNKSVTDKRYATWEALRKVAK